MKYKYYRAYMACRDGKTRTLRIMTDASDNVASKDIILTGCSLEMSKSDDVFEALRYISGKISVQCVDGVTPGDFLPSGKKSHLVTITRGNVCEFYGYIACETRSQDYPSDGDSFEISIISPLGIGKGTRIYNDKQTWETDTIHELIRGAFYDAGGNSSGNLILPKLWDNCFCEQIARLCSTEEVDTHEFVNGEFVEKFIETKTVGDVLTDIANFYGVTFIERGYDLIAVAPDYSDYKYCELDPQAEVEFADYTAALSTTVDDLLGYGSQDINVAPEKIEVTTSIDNISDVMEFDENKFYLKFKNENEWSYNNFYLSAFKYPEQNESIGGWVSSVENKSKDKLHEAFPIQEAGSPSLGDGGSFLNINATDGGPSGMCIVSYGLERLTDKYELATLKSKSFITSGYDKLRISFKASAIMHNPNGNIDYYFPLYGHVNNPGAVDVQIKIGEWDSGWIAVDSSNSKLTEDNTGAVEFESTYTISPTEKHGAVIIKFRAAHNVWADAQYCSTIILHDINVNYVTTSNDKIEYREFKEFKYTHYTDFYGNEYSHNLPYSVIHPGIIGGAWNMILNASGEPFYLIDNKQYEEWMLDRLTTQLSDLNSSLELPVEISAAEVNNALVPFITHNSSTYLLTGFSRDYMTGIDTIKITSIQ